MDPEKRLNILHVIDSGGLYGAEMMLLSLMEEQRRSGDNPILCSIGTAFDEEKEIERSAARQGFEVIPVRMSVGLNIGGALRILQIARNRPADMIHSHGYKGNILLGSLTGKVRRLPMVSTLHGWTSTGNFSRMRIYEWLDCISLNGVDAVITVNREVSRSKKFRWCRNRLVKCIPNGIPVSAKNSPALLTDDPIVSFCRSRFVIGAIGRLSPEKGFNTLIHAFRDLHDLEPETRLVIIGEGTERSRLESLVRELSLSDSVTLPGYRIQADRYLSVISCFVISSFTEGLPISLLEAMRAGTPVISTDVGGIAEALDFGKSGALVLPGDTKALAAAMLATYRNPLLAAQKAASAKKNASFKYSAETMARSYREVYNQLLSAS